MYGTGNQADAQPEYTPLTNDEYSDIMTALQVACGERNPIIMPLSTVQVAAIRDLYHRLATLDVATTPYVWHTEAQLQAANNEVCDALVPPMALRKRTEYEAYVAHMYHVSMTNVSAYLPHDEDCTLLVYYPTFCATALVRSDGTVAWLSIESDA